MIKLNKLTSGIFENSSDEKNNGLYADLSDLMAMRRYVKTAGFNHFDKASSIDSGNLKSVFKGRGIEMEEVREYQFGDDVRDIDWRVTARMNEPYTKIYAQERNREIYAWLDLSPIMTFGSSIELKSVTASKLAAFLGWLALDNKDRFGCIIFDGQNSWSLKPQNDRSSIAAICRKIAQTSQNALQNTVNDGNAKLKSLKMLSQQSKKGGSIFIITSIAFWDDSYNTEFVRLAKNNKLFVFNVFDSLERKAPLAGQYMASFGNEKIVFDTDDKSYRQAYADYFALKYNKWQDNSKHFGYKIIDFTQKSVMSGNFKIF